MLSQRRAFRRSTSIARRGGHKSIWAMRSALVFALRLLRLGRPAIGSYWSLPATEYRRKAAGGSLQPELAFPSERQVSGQSTNIAPRGGRRSISAMLLARVFAPGRPRSSSWLRVPNSGRVAGARQRIHRFPIRVGIMALEPAWLSSPGSPRGRPPRLFSLSSRRCRIKFRLTPLKPNISRIQVLASCRLQGDLHGHNTDEAHGSANERLVKVGHWHQPITGLQRSTERQIGTFCQSCDGDSFSARTVCNRDAEWQWLTSDAFLVFDSEMCRRTQWFYSPNCRPISASGRGKPTAQFQLCR